MIDLITGTPGASKTLSRVAELAKLWKDWDKHPERARPVYVHNIKDLALPHAPMPTKEYIAQKGAKPQIVPDWSLMEDGALVIIDEAQGCFPPRANGSQAPEHVEFLNTHRHRGFDIWVITQHPRLLDFSLRALVGKHIHYRRLFGMKRSIAYEWDACSDSLSGFKNAVVSYFSFPSKAFEWYKSAEVHTKQKFRLPLWLGLPVLALALAVVFVPRAYSTLTNGMHGKGIKESPSVPIAQAPAASAAVHPVALANGAPAALKPLESVSVPAYAGCVKMGNRCGCVTFSGQYEPEPPRCRESAERGGLLVAFDMSHHVSDPSPSPVRETVTETAHSKKSAGAS